MVFVSPNSGVELETIRAQVRSRGAKAGVLRECLGSVRRILEGASGNLAAEALLRRMPTVIAALSHYLPPTKKRGRLPSCCRDGKSHQYPMRRRRYGNRARGVTKYSVREVTRVLVVPTDRRLPVRLVMVDVDWLCLDRFESCRARFFSRELANSPFPRSSS